LAIKKKYAQPFAKSERKKIGLQNSILPELRSANFRIADRMLGAIKHLDSSQHI